MWSIYRGGRRNGGICSFIGDYVEGFCVFSSQWELLWACDCFVFDNDRGGLIEEFDGDEKILGFTGN